MIAPGYRGRFAPSPTGPLHFGSILAALASWLDARHCGGRWLLRMEDLDLPRQEPGADTRILRTLEQCGLTWDEEVVWQSRRTALYQEALEKLRQQGKVFPCACTRREVAAEVYPGTCHKGIAEGRKARAWRVRVAPEVVGFDDRLQGRFTQNLETEAGDFVVLRADGLFAYQLAVVVDDADQRISDVVRGADLLDSAPRQIWLQRLLSLPPVRYMHVPVAVDAKGEKVSKQKRARQAGAEALAPALAFLGHPVPPELQGAPPAEVLAWAVREWNPAQIPAVRAIRAPSPAL